MMAHDGVFRFVDSTDRGRSHDLHRPDIVKLRIAHITDIHVPGEVDLAERMRDFVSRPDSFAELSHLFSAMGNDFGHRYRTMRRMYSNMLKRALVGLHGLSVDHLIITGDLVHCGLAPEFLEMQKILEVTGWSDPQKLTIVPGNHDRFNLFERIERQPMEAFFDVVKPREPRFKRLGNGIVLLEIDSNRDQDDRHFAETWLPNTVGRIYPEVLDFIEDHRAELAGNRILTLFHHHISNDWYPFGRESFGGLMKPMQGGGELLEATSLIDVSSLLLHGHIHRVMPVDYMMGSHALSCPGGFAEHTRVNLLDVTTHDQIEITQAELET